MKLTENIDVYITDTGKHYVVNYHRLTGGTDDDGYPNASHLGYIIFEKRPNEEEMLKALKEKFPEMLL